MSPSELALLLLLAIAGHTQARARPRPDMFCIFHGKKYSPGDSWHPYLEPQGVVYCIRCMCSESGSVTCYKIKCPILQCIHTVTDPHQCCPRCVETPSGLRAAPKVCQHNGTTYQQGEMFTTQELFPSRQSNQCVQCSCSDGQIYCGLVTCPELVCSSPMTVPDSCCPVCRDTGSFERSVEEEPLNRGVRHSHDHCISELLSKRSFGATESTSISSSLGFNPRSFKQKGGGGGTTIKILMKEKHKKACIYNGRTYSHGEVWHPVFRNFGAIPCVLCTCKDGTQDCQRVTCPEEYPCDNPEKVEGKCCKVCQDDKVKPTEIATARCVKNPHKILVYMYMSPNGGNQKENLRKIAIEKEASEDVEIYVWKMVKGIFHLIQIKKVAKQDFRQEAEHFRLVTRTSEGQWNIFRPQPPDLNMTEITELQSEAL